MQISRQESNLTRYPYRISGSIYFLKNDGRGESRNRRQRKNNLKTTEKIKERSDNSTVPFYYVLYLNIFNLFDGYARIIYDGALFLYFCGCEQIVRKAFYVD